MREVEFFVRPGLENPCPILIREGNQISGDTSSAHAVDRVRSWLKKCSEHHELCIQSRMFFPRRAVEIISGSDTPQTRLVEDLAITAEYVCLSHCWRGSQPECITLKATIDANKNGVPWDSHPKTFQDAIQFAYELGHRYIWIDSVCIVQDDSLDWLREASKMSEIYKNSVLTLAVMASSNSSQGCIRKSNGDHVGREIHVQTENEKYIVSCREPLPHGTLMSTDGSRHLSPLLDRGWVYQERILSPRVLYFTAEEIAWECFEDFWCECTREPEQGNIREWKHYNANQAWNNLKRNHVVVFRQENLWETQISWSIVYYYTRLKLTFQKDKLPAIAGLTREMKPTRGSYLAGLWGDSLVEDLAWRAFQPTRGVSNGRI